MQATGPQGPIPAADVVVEGLPRLTFTEDSLGMLIHSNLSLLIYCQPGARTRTVPFARMISTWESRLCECPARES